MRPRVRVPPCRFCAKTFRRTEHLRRHERTHTKEKPFACKCGRSFSRSDLLARHDRLAHGQEDPDLTTSNKEQAVLVSQTHEVEERSRLIESGANSPYASPIGVGSNAHSHDPVHVQRGRQPEPFLPNSSTFASTSTAATSSFEGTLPMPCHPMQDSSLPAPLPSLDFDQQQVQTTGFMDQPAWELSLGDDLDFLWNDIEVHSARDLVQSFAMNYAMNFQFSMPPDDVFNPGAAMFTNAQGGNDDLQPDSGALSRFGSRLPSVQPSGADTRHHASDPPQASPAANGRLLQPPPTSDKVNVPWRLSKAEYCLIHDIIRDRRSVLPPDFVMPSRHALCRYIEGYFSGFHEHLPFVHLPTISLATESPELILAIASTGARYRFQRRQAHHLYLAARAVLGEQLRLRDECALPGSVFSTLGSLCDGSISSLSPPSLLDASRRPKTAADCQPHSTAESIRRDVRTMQAMIILIAMGTWNHRSLIKDAFATASQLALLVREDGLDVSDFQPAHLTWDEWVIAEGRRRTKLVAFCFLNLHCIVSNSPPKLMNTDVGSLHLPCPESHWKATDEHEWAVARKKDQHTELSVQKGYSCLFTRPADAQADDTISSFGNYVLIHCLVQQIFFNRQSTLHFGESRSASLPTEALTKLESALRVWQQNWEATQDSSLDPSAPGGPLSFNSTALFRLAYLRLHADFGPCRQLETRDARSIARAFHNAGLLERSPCVNRAILQSAHSLSIPVRIGIEFVARTQTLNWSIVHSLCNLECALFLGKWLETIASALHRCEPLEEDEKRLLGIVASIISETDLGLGLKLETDAVRRTRTMAVAVIRLWAFTFKGAHVFDIMGTIGAGLDLCADMLQQELDVPPS